MNWTNWKKIFGETAQKLSVGDIVYFRRGDLPQSGRVVGEGNEIRVPLMRCEEHGTITYHRVYWRNRSQLYVRRNA